MRLEKLLTMQKELMAQVPHDVRPDVYPKMVLATELIKGTLLYLGSCGHKPWRPKPLDFKTRYAYYLDVVDMAKMIGSPQERITEYLSDKGIGLADSRQMVSALGVTEEAMEFLDSLHTEDGSSQLEEITDVLFFYLELVAMSGFTVDQIEEEYIRKHAVNLKRYEDGKKGDYGWDDRQTKKEL